MQGAIELNNKALEGNFLFIYPPSFEELRKRIGNRIEDEACFKVRIADAIKQVEMANNSVLFTNRLVNDRKEMAIDQFCTLIENNYFQEIQAKARENAPKSTEVRTPKETTTEKPAEADEKHVDEKPREEAAKKE